MYLFSLTYINFENFGILIIGHHELPDDPASTEMLCLWNAPKSTKVDPVVLKRLSFEQRTPLESERGTKRKDFTTFDPVAPLKRPVNADKYRALVRTINLMQFHMMKMLHEMIVIP